MHTFTDFGKDSHNCEPILEIDFRPHLVVWILSLIIVSPDRKLYLGFLFYRKNRMHVGGIQSMFCFEYLLQQNLTILTMHTIFPYNQVEAKSGAQVERLFIVFPFLS